MTTFTNFKIDDLKQGVYAELSTQLGMIRVSGADARHFLHAQLTQDIIKFSVDETKLAGYCSAKGRLFAVFQVYIVDDMVFLVTRRELVELLVKRLKMFVLRANVVIEDVSVAYHFVGVSGTWCLTQGMAECKQNTQRLGLLPVIVNGEVLSRELMIVAKDSSLYKGLNDARDIGVDGWQWLAICAGEGHVETATLEAFVPQMINLDRVDGVNFKKGCYPGQEVVARSHYLGKLKRRMLPVRLSFKNVDDANSALSVLHAHLDVYSSSDTSQAAGVLVAVAKNLLDDKTIDALVEVSLPMLDGGGKLSIVGVKATLERLELPYTLVDKSSEDA